ncbi:restriction endonuclease subunit S, partial [Bifidobacterium catenulatum]
KSRKPIKKEKRIAGKTPYYGASGVVDYVDGFTHEGDYLLLSEDGANLLARSMPIAYQISGRNWINSHAHVLRIENANLRQLVEMYLNSISLEPYITKGAQPKLTKQRMETIAVPVPSEDYLSRIVEMLTKFYALTTSLTDGLPAEIEARRKQYEYYRDRLLSFDELAV